MINSEARKRNRQNEIQGPLKGNLGTLLRERLKTLAQNL